MMLWLYVAGIAVAELVTTYINPIWGILVHGLILAGLFISAVLNYENVSHRMYLALTPAPLIRIITLGLPLWIFPLPYWFVLTGAAMFAAVVSLGRLFRYRMREIGINLNRVFLQILVTLSGFGLGYLEYLILRPEPMIEELSWQALWLPALLLMFFTGWAEEIAFRGVMQKAAVEALGKLGILPVSIVFGVLHIGHLSMLDVVFVFAVGLFFAEVTYRTKSIIGVSLAHGITNITLYLVWPFLL